MSYLEIRKAWEFFSHCPTGQYDNEACKALKFMAFYLHDMRACHDNWD